MLPQPELQVGEVRAWRQTHWGPAFTAGTAQFQHEFEEREPTAGERTLLFTIDGGVMLPFLAVLAARYPELEIELLLPGLQRRLRRPRHVRRRPPDLVLAN